MDITTTMNGSIDQTFALSTSDKTAFMCILYIVLGVLSIFANIINISIFLTSRELRSNYIFHIVVDFGEIVNGLSYITCGIGRGSALIEGLFTTPITAHDCFYNRYWTVLLILGTEIPAWMTIVCAVERVVAVHNPTTYLKYFNKRNKILLVLASMSCIGGSMVWAALSALHNERINLTRHCSIIESTGRIFSTTHFVFVPFAYVGSFVSLCVIAFVHRVGFCTSSYFLCGMKADNYSKQQRMFT
uniref:G_PROTEIN_RECEP_F1_2 domain-containing protein n=1 Tax=Panagrellus redivivus TaxID=6233 RepID=A0A7E4URN1_PANRE